MSTLIQNLGKIIPNHRGAYVSSFQYNVLDEVFYQNTTYRVHLKPPVGTLPTNTTYWVKTLVQVGMGDKYDIPIWIQNRPREGEVYPRLVMTNSVVFVTDMEGSVASSISPATEDAVISIQKNSVTFGTITFTAGSTTGIFDSLAGAVFEPSDILTVVLPSPRDETLSNISITLAGTR